MRLNKYLSLFLFLFIQLCGYADIPMEKPVKLPETKYYFANVDSFSNYSFFVKKIKNGKTYKIKQGAAFLLNSTNYQDNKMEIWAEQKGDKQKSNSFFLSSAKQSDVLEGNTAYIAIQFYFDKTGKLNYKKTVMKPECYDKKNTSPFFVFFNKGRGNNSLFFLSIFSFLILFTVSIFHKLPERNAYI